MDRSVSGVTVHRPSALGTSAVGDSCLLMRGIFPASSLTGAMVYLATSHSWNNDFAVCVSLGMPAPELSA